ncbi:MFS transporter [Lysinibacillus sp. 2017]|uniref:MFS transporter n=1 Tax=unclassified Lysinibacillus TaxID=2636778 RepID=UPI000D526DA9|nr:MULTISPECIES: MFS transporter [unclassified Lysinibacillus]AWE08475.1 MFS transporter [Lysinibacillus sp. 2017]TGN34963.1 MFS transporter [Lysinibacillus sp. S2017]
MTSDQRKKLALLMLNMFIAVGSFGIIIPIIPAYLKEIGQGGTAAGLIIAIFAFTQFLVSPIGGKWTDKYGRRPLINIGLLTLAISMFIFYFANSIWLLYLSRAIGGIGCAFLIPAIYAYVADITTMDQRAKGNSFISAAMSLGIVIGPGIGGFLADYGLKIPLLVSAIVGVLAFVVSFFTLKESQLEKETIVEGLNQSMVKDIILSVKKPFFIPLVITLIMSFGLMAYETVLGLYVDDKFGATPQEIAFMVTATGLVGVIMQLFVVDWIVKAMGELNVLKLFLIVTAFGFLLSIIAGSYRMFFAISLLIFLATSILRPVLTTLISKLAGNEQGFAMGMNNAYMSIGNILGPLLAGALYDIRILYPFIAGLIILVLTTIFTFMWKGVRLQKSI